MPAVQLTADQVELLLTLCQTNSDIVNVVIARAQSSTAPMDLRNPEQSQRLVAELELTHATMKALKEAAK